MRYDWPGNIRELQNVIERSVILTPGRVLQIGLPAARNVAPSGRIAPGDEAAEEAAEREYCVPCVSGVARLRVATVQRPALGRAVLPCNRG
jgi:DNA-binding NtrC family response regulator